MPNSHWASMLSRIFMMMCKPLSKRESYVISRDVHMGEIKNVRGSLSGKHWANQDIPSGLDSQERRIEWTNRRHLGTPFPKKKLIAIGCKFKKPVGIEKVCNRIGCKFSMIQRRVPQSSEWKTHLCACVCTCLQHGVQAARTRTHTHHSHTQTHHTPTQFRRALDSPDRYRLFK